ncbi:aldo/keto reductase [Sphingomonas sp. LB3N6]|uniref:aldo/keto reductase n=1 Tax=Sphingomonas fucosidasi TaxID=3096164 RepID=UPI002FCCAFC6
MPLTEPVAAVAAVATAIPRPLGRTGLNVFPVGLGAMALSMPGAVEADDAPAAVVRAALDAGVNFIDTANVYCPIDAIGANERLLRDTLRALGIRDVVIATKGGVDRVRRKVDASPAFLRASCIASLVALGCRAITLYQLHAVDDDVPLEDSIGELARLQAEGRIVHLGICNATADELARAQRTARIETLQNACNPWQAEDYTNGTLDACVAQGVSYIPHSVVGGAGRQAAVATVPAIVAIAQRYGVSAQAVVVAWHLAMGPSVIPIPGASRVASIVSSAASVGLTLTAAEVRSITAVGS